MMADYNRLGRAPRTKSATNSVARRTGGSVFGRPGSLHVERLGPGDLAVGIGGNLVDAGLGLPQQFLAAALQRLATLIDRDRFLERHLAVLQPLHDRFELLDRALEGEFFDVHLGIFGHIKFPNAPPKSAESNTFLGAYCGGGFCAPPFGGMRPNPPLY